MVRRLRHLTFALLVATTAWASDAEEQAERLDEILHLVREGVSDAVIVKHIEASDFVFELVADDLLELRDLGVSDAVLEALLDTALDAERPRRSRRTHSRPSTSIVVSAGYFSPWYAYPYAWGFYYDPFPSCYSYYYYPFRTARSWGYYGHSRRYYYRHHWRPYRYDNRRHFARAHQRSAVRVALPAPRVRDRDRIDRDRRTPVRVRDRVRVREGAERVERPSVRRRTPVGHVRPRRTPAVRPRAVPAEEVTRPAPRRRDVRRHSGRSSRPREVLRPAVERRATPAPRVRAPAPRVRPTRPAVRAPRSEQQGVRVRAPKSRRVLNR